jgi:hypothetical protein
MALTLMTHVADIIVEIMNLDSTQITAWKLIKQRPVLFVLLFLFFLGLLFFPEFYSEKEIEALFQPIKDKYGIKISYKIDEEFFSPIENPIIPVGPAKGSKAESIRRKELIRYKGILNNALEKYSVQMIQDYLNGIYIVEKIESGGPLYVGTYDPFRHIIYLVDLDDQSDDDVVYTFHHEFSSLLIRSHSFFVNPWTDHHPKDFRYISEIYESHSEVKRARKAIKDYYELGIVTNYGLTDFENDFNEYSAMILTYPHKFKKIMDQYPRVRGKFLVWLDFYQKIDPIFTEEYLFGNG